jgi:hypothetical protein
MVKGFNEDFEFWYQTAKHGADFPRACSLAINGVVDEIN